MLRALAKDLEKLGFEVFPGDIERNNILYKNGRCTQLDLNGPLPFKDSTFDYVVCVAGVEHIENPHHLIREFARVIKGDGSLVITTPNVMTIKSRLRFLFYSYFDWFKYIGPLPPEEERKLKDIGLAFDFQHINSISYAELKFILEKGGFESDKVETNRMVRKHKAIYPFIKWLVKYKTKKIQSDPFFISDTILEGEYLICYCKKRTSN